MSWRFALVLVAAASCNSSTSEPDPAVALARKADELLDNSIPIDYSRPFTGTPVSRAAIREIYGRACDAGDRRSCWMIEQIGDMLGASGLPDARATKNCNAGDVMSCRAVADHIKIDAGATPAEIERHCSAGMPGSCELLWSTTTMPHRQERLDDMRRKGCEHDIVDECQWLEQSPLVSEKERERVIVRRCIVTFDCRATSDPETGNKIWIPEVLERGCQYGNNDGQCQTLVELYESKRAVEPTPGRAKRLHAWLCKSSTSDVVQQWCRAHPST